MKKGNKAVKKISLLATVLACLIACLSVLASCNASADDGKKEPEMMKMTREEWEAAFDLESVRVNGYCRVTADGQITAENNFCYYIDGDVVRCINGDDVIDTDRLWASDIFLGEHYDRFTETSSGVFEAPSVQFDIGDDEPAVRYEVKVIMDNEGRPKSVSLNSYLWDECYSFEYTFDSWGEIDLR